MKINESKSALVERTHGKTQNAQEVKTNEALLYDTAEPTGSQKTQNI